MIFEIHSLLSVGSLDLLRPAALLFLSKCSRIIWEFNVDILSSCYFTYSSDALCIFRIPNFTNIHFLGFRCFRRMGIHFLTAGILYDCIDIGELDILRWLGVAVLLYVYHNILEKANLVSFKSNRTYWHIFIKINKICVLIKCMRDYSAELKTLLFNGSQKKTA